MKIVVRNGCDADAPAAIDVLRKSISELCVPDHEGDAREIAGWLSNKTQQAWCAWLARSDATVLVAERAGEIVGVGMIDHHGTVLLNYVRPDARFSGVSKAILESLENVAVTAGLRECVLESTITARTFYEGCGYKPANATGLTLAKTL
ncbi:GNAT family N-acetyltransferase [Sulfitobacter pseudonitzschiae]|uniref:GNAT family N-acetyltransferase n=1 Tax=Pseudosulfitobacter pseudonitzschiae TaxID=1402135 RepID=A0A9Q2P581_9RHOB|nr:GNAT family N-acetyltransferase [Pseudosulfitobacter pseudonitzschiae]MBM2299585.1 GNAT family N-acetyltransferase [Pseudosulfitobacter pseudonitzschiae]MBM2304509.1 GNAT family N-acetyltransferase [Pseudosulfitobacter pseudonitzschiae]MBM2314229.1 GNAT family N-acetyltransferase [Pseudosulfitobacter pseudonitzschiae]MBM2319170.1 GNAT family N-acetyltransferase [Pseudosulfitobacter pseudonitzschiae]